MDYDKEYFQKKLRESKRKYKEASEADQEKMRRTATRMADKSRSENLVGLAIDDPDRLRIENWKGENLLGFILTRLRKDLIEL